MKLISAVGVALLFSLSVVAARADNATPVPQDTSVSPVPVATEPVTAPTPADTPVVDTTAVIASPDHSTPVTSGNGSSSPQTGTDSGPTSAPAVSGEGNHPIPDPRASSGQSPAASSGNNSPGSSASPPFTLPPPSAGPAGLDLTVDPSTAQAPAQLICRGSDRARSGPFLVSPYGGWTDVVSFVDHDLPDYEVDGKIVLANGLTATAGDGSSSDFFPSYWSPQLRQYVNYDGHNGYDFDISYQPVLAAAAGTVTFAGWNESDPYAGYGQMVLINHHNGYVTLYGHLSELDVHKGERVAAGQRLGISGTTGHSSGPHLHFSVFHNCHVTDPYGWTGHGKDPLAGFNGERSGYLWLPGHDPLLLNPPPGWPAYPSGVRVSLPSLEGSRIPSRSVPPADRLLLLALPSAGGTPRVGPGLGLATTEEQVSEEAQSLTPTLQRFQSEGSVTAYQVIPAAAAIWVRGTVSAAQLESLPGVASLSGVTPQDVAAAEGGLAHAVLVEIGQQQAPSLWPLGFRSALHAYRPIVTALSGSSLLAGFAVPGARVVASLQRGNGIPAAALSTADPATGGFVLMLHDSQGRPVGVRPGDVVSVQTGKRTAQIAIQPLVVRARPDRVDVRSLGSAAVTVSTSSSGEGPTGATLVAGHASLHLKELLAAGSLAVASIRDGAGNQEAAVGTVPGVVVTEGSSILRGWSVSPHPLLTVYRSHRPIWRATPAAASEGAFQVTLTTHGHPLYVEPGDVIQIGSRHHHRSFAVPRLGARFSKDSQSVSFSGPAHARIAVGFIRPLAAPWTRSVEVDSGGRSGLTLPARPSIGSLLSASLALSGGDILVTKLVLRDVHAVLGSPVVSGIAPPGTLVAIRVEPARRGGAGEGSASSDPRTGAFVVDLRAGSGAAMPLRRGDHLEVDTAGVASAVTLPMLGVRVVAGRIRVRASAGTSTMVEALYPGGASIRHSVRIGPSGLAWLTMPSIHHQTPSAATAVLLLSGGVTVERNAGHFRKASSSSCGHRRSSSGCRHRS